jgi:transposase
MMGERNQRVDNFVVNVMRNSMTAAITRKLGLKEYSRVANPRLHAEIVARVQSGQKLYLGSAHAVVSDRADTKKINIEVHSECCAACAAERLSETAMRARSELATSAELLRAADGDAGRGRAELAVALQTVAQLRTAVAQVHCASNARVHPGRSLHDDVARIAGLCDADPACFAFDGAGALRFGSDGGHPRRWRALSRRRRRRRGSARARDQGSDETMIPVPAGVRIWIATGRTDMRKGMRGLALLVQEGLGRDPFAGDVFVFRGHSGALIKALWHDGIGLSLYAKRLDRGRFIWPQTVDGVVSLTSAQMSYLLEAIDWRNPQHTWRPQSAG